MGVIEKRDCERICVTCRQPLHYSRFCKRERKTPDGSIWQFDPECKACQQIKRNKAKNIDRPLAIIANRAASRAARLGVSRKFMWENMNWRALVPIMRAMMSPEGKCLSCGHVFLNERDIQVEHRESPRSDIDWARHHARNIALDCQSCNGSKRDKVYTDWLDEQEEARLSNDRYKAQRRVDPESSPQGALFPANEFNGR
jgi:5-methylcytosine-specific restriction endonuclease McrA